MSDTNRQNQLTEDTLGAELRRQSASVRAGETLPASSRRAIMDAVAQDPMGGVSPETAGSPIGRIIFGSAAGLAAAAVFTFAAIVSTPSTPTPGAPTEIAVSTPDVQLEDANPSPTRVMLTGRELASRALGSVREAAERELAFLRSDAESVAARFLSPLDKLR